MTWVLRSCSVLAGLLASVLILQSGAEPAKVDRFPEGWEPATPREEIRPQFLAGPAAGPEGKPALVIRAGDSVGQHGWFRKSFPVTGGTWVRFQTRCRTENVASPRRSTPVRIVWQDAQGKMVRADVPPGRENEPGAIPLAEPEHPLPQGTDAQGWTTVGGVYRVPSKATQAIAELHLQWSPGGQVIWSEATLVPTTAPPARKVRLASVHHVPSGKSMRANCEEYAPLLADAAKQKADLVVLGETVPYVRVGKKPHETAEPIPGPTTEYFAGLARKHGLHLVVSLYEREGPVVYNAAVLLDPEGKLVGKYRKVCLPHSEVEAGVTPGCEYPVFDTRLGKIGMMICYDGFFPEVARELTARGAEIIAFPVWGCNPLLVRARACENHVLIVSSTYTDAKSDWMVSAVFDHAGDILTRAQNWGEVVVAEVDLSRRYFWRNNLGDMRSMVQRHRPTPPATK